MIAIYVWELALLQAKGCFESGQGSLRKIDFGIRDIEVVRFTVEEK